MLFKLALSPVWTLRLMLTEVQLSLQERFEFSPGVFFFVSFTRPFFPQPCFFPGFTRPDKKKDCCWNIEKK